MKIWTISRSVPLGFAAPVAVIATVSAVIATDNLPAREGIDRGAAQYLRGRARVIGGVKPQFGLDRGLTADTTVALAAS